MKDLKFFFLVILTLVAFTPLLAKYAEVDTLLIAFKTDHFPSDNHWSLRQGNTQELIAQVSGTVLEPNTRYTDTLFIPAHSCWKFQVKDDQGNGFGEGGFIQLTFNGLLVFSATDFDWQTEFFWNCRIGEICPQAKEADPGPNHLDTSIQFNWLTLRPLFDTYFDIHTLSDCDTRIWIYDECKTNYADGPAGALYFNDDFEDKQARIPQVLLRGGERYLIRVDLGASCNSAQLVLTDLGLKGGCTDQSACNFDPLANLDDGSCFYAQCFPDLAVNHDVFLASIYLDTITNTNACMIEEGCLRGYGKRDILRFSTQIDNVGNADYIVGPPQKESPHFSDDNCHDHWHYLGYAEYILYDGQQQPLPIGFKNGFCALDTWCAEDDSYKYGCDYMGISAGCYDIYESDLLCQWVDVTDLPDGVYTLVVRVNWNRLPDLFGRSEMSFENNWAQVCVQLDRSSGELEFEILENCPTYQDCLGFTFGQTVMDCESICGGQAHYGDADRNGRVDMHDFDLYLDALLDTEPAWSNCLDLHADGLATLYDAYLLMDCLNNDEWDESESGHSHCVFPAGLTVDNDDLNFRLIKEDSTASIIVQMKSSADVAAMELSFDGEEIGQVDYLNAESVILKYSHSKILLVFPEERLLRQSGWHSILKIFPGNEGSASFCFVEASEVVTSMDERVIPVNSGQCIEFITTEVREENLDTEVKIWPNPVSGHLVVFTDIEWKKTWSILNTLGETVMTFSPRPGTRTGISLPMEKLLPGVYFLKVGPARPALKFIKL